MPPRFAEACSRLYVEPAVVLALLLREVPRWMEGTPGQAGYDAVRDLVEESRRMSGRT